MSLRTLHVTSLALGAVLAAASHSGAAHAAPRLIDGMEPIELEEPVRPIKVIPDVDPLPPVQITERIVVDPDPEAFPESGVQHPDSLPVFMLAPIAPSDILDSKTNIERCFGNNSWGGCYRLYSHVRALSLSYQSINHESNITGKLFGKSIQAFKMTAATWNPRDDYRSSRLDVFVGGSQIFSQFKENPARIGATDVVYNKGPIDKTLLSTSKTFDVGPVPVTVKGSIGTRYGANLASRAYRNTETTSGVSFKGTASADAYARLSASIGVPGFGAGVRGSVELVEIAPTLDIALDRSGPFIIYKNNFSVGIGSLDGYVEVFAEAFWNEWSKVILDWEGYHFNHVVSQQSGVLNFGGPVKPIGPIGPIVIAQSLETP